jgi:hypothetical protein
MIDREHDLPVSTQAKVLNIVRHQHQLDRMHGLKNGGFLVHRNRMENDDETEIRSPWIVGTGREGHPPGDKEAVLG